MVAGTSTSAASSAEQNADMTLQAAIGASKDGADEELALLSADHPPRELVATNSSPQSNSSATRSATAACGKAKASGSSNVSAVYRWYEVEEAFSAKKREESSIAKCKLCRQQGKPERKTCVRFSKSVTSNLWRHLKENHPDMYEKHRGEKKSVQMHRVMGVKKRGRKKKVVAPTPPPTADIAHDVGGTNKSQSPGDNNVQSTMRPSAKKPRRGDYDTQAYPHYALGALHPVPSRQTVPAATNAASPGKFNPEKVREAMGYLCLYEMLPFELCSSHAFRNLMVECSGGPGGYVDDSNSFELFAKEISFGYAKKMAAEVKVRTAMQMKMTDFSHFMLSEWRSSDYLGGNDTVATSSMGYVAPRRDNDVTFLALFAVGLDQEFNPFRRCLHVLSIGNYLSGQGNSIVAKLAGDKELTKAMDRVVPCRYMPEILAVEAPSNEYQSFCDDHKLRSLESVPTVLQNIMVATINGVPISGSYCLGSEVLTDVGSAGSAGFRTRRLDKGEYIESSAAVLTTDSFYGVSTEIASSILEELPTSLTGHTYRDLINKVMYLLAHFKQSPRSRAVLRRLALQQCSMSADSYERLFIDRLRDTAISLGEIHSVLSLVEVMMPALKQYFSVHKDSDSDFSKLIQLSCLSRYEWSRVRYLTVILKPFAEATTKLDSEQYVVSSLIVPSIFTLIEKLRGSHPLSIGFTGESSTNSLAKKNDGEVMGELPEDIEALRDLAFVNLSTCFGHLFSFPEASWSLEKRQTFNLLWSATILDPRTRSFIIKGSLPQQEFWDIVKTEAATLQALR